MLNLLVHDVTSRLENVNVATCFDLVRLFHFIGFFQSVKKSSVTSDHRRLTSTSVTFAQEIYAFLTIGGNIT